MAALRALRPALRAVRAARIVPAPVFVPAARFHASPLRFGSGETDAALAASLAAEHAYETESTSDSKPQFVVELENDGVWTLQDTANHDDVVVTRKFGDETLKLTFQVSDLDNADPVETVDAEGNVIEDGIEPPNITSSLLITKSGSNKALTIDLTAGQDGFAISNVAIYDKALASEEGANGDWNRRSRYMGPQFDTLDQAVQDAFYDFVSERGVNEALSNFVVQFSEHKEQKDYVTWLKDVKEFVNV